MSANNETGVIQDIPAITKITRQHDVLVLTDCVQALGKIPVDVHGWDVDYASFSAHKLYGPKGIGALYIKQGSPFSPLLHGGHQENGFRAGTESLHNIAGFGAACRDVDKLLADAERIRTLKNQLIRRFKEIKPDCVIHSPADTECLPNTISITFPGVENAELMTMLNYRGIAVSVGSACSTGDDKPSHVLKAIGLSDQASRETIRISLGHHTSARDIRYAAQVFQDCVEGRTHLVINRIQPAQLDETILFNEQTYILDIRPPSDRRKWKGLPNSHEVNPFRLERYLDRLPMEKHIVVVCPGGGHSFMIAYYLKTKGFKRVSDLRGGLHTWRMRRSDLYRKYAGQNVTALTLDE
jgi:rhodanese-related sulfurtransferase